MITEAIWAQRHYIKGESVSGIRNWIRDRYDINDNDLKQDIKSEIQIMLKETKDGFPCLLRTDENYRLHPEWRKKWAKKYGKKQKRKPRKKRDPLHPKGPKNAYLFYCQAKRNQRRDDYPEKTMTELTTILSAEWKELSSRRKKKYEDMAKDDKKRYQREMREYERNKSSSGSESSSDSQRKRKRKRRPSDSEDSKSHSNKKRRSRHGSKSRSRSSASSESEDDKKKKVERKKSTYEESKSEKTDPIS